MSRLSLVALALLVAACRHDSQYQDPSPYRVEGDAVLIAKEALASTGVVSEPVRLAGDGQVSVTGRLVWDEDVTVRVFPPVSGRVMSIAVDAGTWVKKGDVLGMLASPDFGQAQADAARAAADLGSSQRTLDRLRQLFARGAAPRKDLEQAEADVERSRAEADRTRERLALWSGGKSSLGTVDQGFPLLSPVKGVVVERTLNVGQEVRSDTTVPLFVVSDPRRLWVLLDVTERDISDVSRETPLAVHSAAYPDRTFKGTLDVLGSSLDPATRTARARGHIENAGGVLKAEMYVTVDLVRRIQQRQLVVPARAVIRGEDAAFLFVEEKPGRYRRTKVEAGPEREGLVPLRRGVSNATRVVTEAALLLEAAWAEGKKS